MPLLILVVDDDPTVRMSTTDCLESSGYSAIAAENGKEALKLIEEYQPHLIVTDITMPQMDGYELIRWVRQRPAFRLMPVVFLTTPTDRDERIRGYQLGGDAYLPKPFEPDELRAVIRNLLERSQLIQSEWRLRAQDQLPERIRVQVAPTHQKGLTQREQEVLKFLGNGLSNSQIGDRLYLSPRTIEKHVSTLLCKTGTSNRVELVRFAMEHHLIE
jgi:DNA-binding NarL/FixJ family response regulator